MKRQNSITWSGLPGHGLWPWSLILYAGLSALIVVLGCSKDRTVSGTEITNGNCMGKIYNPDGTAAKGVVVKLIPMDYNPFVQRGDSLDSTYTNVNGDYSFNASQSKFYNILAEKGSFSCLQDSIFVQAQAQTIVDNDTLRESGIVKGIIRLKPGDDGRNAVILVLGTNTYAIPSDTSGNFTIPPLPKGSYTMRIFSTQGEYAVFDTNVAVQAGTITKIDISLPSANAPSVVKLSESFDSATMFVSLAWPMPDTSKIVSYALYRKSKIGNDTRVMLDKSATSYTDDVVGFDGDSVSYEIAGMGKNYKEGNRTSTRTIIVRGKVYCVKKMDLTNISTGLYSPGAVSIFSCRKDEIFLEGNKVIYQLDTNGIVRKDHRLDDSVRLVQRDNAGHFYIYKEDNGRVTVVKLNSDLNVIAQFPLDSGVESSVPASTMVLRSGTMYAFYRMTDSASGDYTGIREYDSTFTMIKAFRYMNPDFVNATLSGDTVVTYEYPADQASDVGLPDIHFYDTAFRTLSVFKAADFVRSVGSGYCTVNYSCENGYSAFIAGPNGLFVLAVNGSDGNQSMLLFADSKGTLLARIIVMTSLMNIYFDSFGNFYCISYEYANDYYQTPIPKTLFKYTMAPLLTAKAQ